MDMGSLNSSVSPHAKRASRWLVVSLVAVTISGCSALDLKMPSFKNVSLKNIKAPWGQTDPAYDLISENLVNSMVQIPLLDPLFASVQMPEPTTKFETEMRTAMLDQGFLLDAENVESGAFDTSVNVEKIETTQGRQNQYSLTIGPIKVSRVYAVVDGETLPVSAQLISGTNERAVDINDDIFADADSELALATFQPLGEEGQVTIIAVPIETAEPKELASNETANETANVVAGVTKNLFETGQSNYVEVFNGYEDIEQSVLVFPNDSLRLGDTNKQIIEQYVSKMDPSTDVLSVIGCSIGITDIKNGNSLLALGRANRVKEAFLFSGLEHEKILEEGCWAPEAFGEALPNRGVVVTLKRQKKS